MIQRFQSEQRAGVSHFEITVRQQIADRRCQIEQPQQVGNGCSGFTDRIGDLLLGQPELGFQAVECERFLERVEIFALDVFDQRHCAGRPVVNIAHQYRHGFQSGPLCSAPAALPGNQLITITGSRPHDQRLHQPLSAY